MPAELPANGARRKQFARAFAITPRLLANGENSARAFSLTWRKTCSRNIGCIAGRNGRFYWQDNDSAKQGSLQTSYRHGAEKLLNAMNEA
jgi:hypothetical protein